MLMSITVYMIHTICDTQHVSWVYMWYSTLSSNNYIFNFKYADKCICQ